MYTHVVDVTEYVAGVRVHLLAETCTQHSGEQVGGAETASTDASDLEKMTKASTALGGWKRCCMLRLRVRLDS